MKIIVLFFSLLLIFSVQAKTRIYFGSCAKQDKDLTILDSINKDKPDVFIFLGDNIYGDSRDTEELAAKYQMLADKANFQTLRAQSEVLAIWDDHDYGENDAGREYPNKHASKKLFLDFWQEPKTSTRHQHQGIYQDYFIGDNNKIHVILPDLRWNRDPLNSVSTFDNIFKRRPNNQGPYKAHQDTSSMLGETQWQWLEQALLKPAKLKIIGSSLQLLPEFTGWESWANYPADRLRLLNFIKQKQINGVMIISGDTHWGELSQIDIGYPLWEITSSGLSEEWKAVSPNRHRHGNYTDKINYGFIDINWQQADPLLTFGLKNQQGKVTHQQRLNLSALSF
ncbi:alkaline phosphatase family protein [Catenovulum sp. SM1970]|uniref:alkaline phosphatase D family protein n=1 Tax=Marinifaba aquimaris TaxID=2741323 RepID=UPI001573D2C2|nr:alkaline phosphatase D family protein [Marinifaba aquimaris]NTS78135.1 alkaline phosphatase family protein [Marinifaba aquimaris]